MLDRRFAARVSGLASGLALAVRPAGLAEVSRVNGAPQARPALAGCGAPLAGGASPDNARPAGCDVFTASGASGAGASPWPWCWRARQRDTAGTAGGRSPGVLCAAARRAVGLASEGRGESCRPATARPLVNPGRLRRVTLAALPSQLLAPVLAVHGRGRQARRAAGAPLKP